MAVIVRIKELEDYVSVKASVVRGGNALSVGERKNVAAAKKEIEQLRKAAKKHKIKLYIHV